MLLNPCLIWTNIPYKIFLFLRLVRSYLVSSLNLCKGRSSSKKLLDSVSSLPLTTFAIIKQRNIATRWSLIATMSGMFNDYTMWCISMYIKVEYDDNSYILHTLTIYFKTYPIYMPVMFMRIVLNKQVIRMRCLLYLSSVHVCD